VLARAPVGPNAAQQAAGCQLAAGCIDMLVYAAFRSGVHVACAFRCRQVSFTNEKLELLHALRSDCS
jgi:hypothetical protein